MAEPIIETQDVSFRYNKLEENWALKDVSVTIQPEEWVTLVGHNGSGKSTLIKTFNGILEVDEGRVVIDGLEVNADNIWKIREKVGMVFQNPDNQFVGTTVEDDVAFGLENMGLDPAEMRLRVQEALERVGMWEERGRAPSNLSGGQKQRVAIAGILALKPKVLILDEATSMLDPKGRLEVLETVKEIKASDRLTVISITHDIDEALESDRILIMNQGQVAGFTTPESLFNQPELMEVLALDAPFSMEVKKELESQGLHLPEDFMTEEELIEWLRIYNLKG